MGQDPLQHGHANLAERILRAAAAADLSARQRVPDMPVFLTGPEFLPELRDQRRHTLTLIDVSERNGQARMVEMNQQVLTNLDRMISEVEKTAPTDEETPHAG